MKIVLRSLFASCVAPIVLLLLAGCSEGQKWNKDINIDAMTTQLKSATRISGRTRAPSWPKRPVRSSGVAGLLEALKDEDNS